MKKVFSNVWVRCISVLLVIAVISGALLAVLSDILFVSADERTSRAIKKIYGEEKNYSVVMDIDASDKNINAPITTKHGQINKLYRISYSENKYDLLFQTTGNGGYKNGTITLWVQVLFDEGHSPSIEKVILEDYKKQTLMSKLTDSFYSSFLVEITNEYYNGKTFTANSDNSSDTVVALSGATYSANACCNAVNNVLEYISNMG